ncbi:hypothetical protein N8I77_012334 [Diaporthe amygdali]|uniref:Uncharacterized protein n=1 Tax=Phomopsis amygdali TaxID=1214568 RepID=A0AAD9VXF0_PHOAM|nr:hypothetical protein N8I77_012334 [Diaporthe amygdali]
MTNSSIWTGTTRTVPYNIYQGVWTNWSRGRIMGPTLTLDRVYGNLLIAFTATFVGIVATATWRISCLCFHRIYSTSDPRDALHHQRQAILRNSASAASGLWTLSKLAWTWRRDSEQLLARTLPVSIFSGLCFCLFTIAAGFSSSISSRVGKEVLLDGHDCGVVYGGYTTNETISALDAYGSQTINNALNYAQECYSRNPTGNTDCTNFIKDHLPGTMDKDAACPFQDGMCRNNQDNLLLDSGYFDSRESFGLNTPDSQRIFFRTTLHCAPVTTAGFSKNVSTPVNNYTQYLYGPSAEQIYYTWQVEDMNAQYLRREDNEVGPIAWDMSLSIISAYTENKTAIYPGFGNFVPDPMLFRPDADLHLIFLSGNGVAFYEPTMDPWYRGFVPWGKVRNYEPSGQWTKNVYRPDEAASPLGCIQQYQWCNAEHKCGELSSFHDARNTAAPFFDTPLEALDGYWDISGQKSSQWAWLEYIIYSAADLRILHQLGAASLASRRNFGMGYMSQIPPDQWKIDVTYWWATLMAATQAAFVNAVHGPKDPSLLQMTLRPLNKYMESLCHNQKILSTDYTSFSLFGLYFTFTVGVLIIFVSYLLEPIFECLARRRKHEEYKYLEWTGNETLQLQRMAYQGLGSEAWSGYTDSIPKTRPGYFLADLHVENSIKRSKEAGATVKKDAQITNTRGFQSQANHNADRPESVTGTDGTDSSTDVQISPAPYELALPAAVSRSGVSSLEMPPELMSRELNSAEPVSPISQVSQPEGSNLAIPSLL